MAEPAPITASTHGTLEDCFIAAMADRRRLFEALQVATGYFGGPADGDWSELTEADSVILRMRVGIEDINTIRAAIRATQGGA